MRDDASRRRKWTFFYTKVAPVFFVLFFSSTEILRRGLVVLVGVGSKRMRQKWKKATSFKSCFPFDAVMFKFDEGQCRRLGWIFCYQQPSEKPIR